MELFEARGEVKGGHSVVFEDFEPHAVADGGLFGWGWMVGS